MPQSASALVLKRTPEVLQLLVLIWAEWDEGTVG